MNLLHEEVTANTTERAAEGQRQRGNERVKVWNIVYCPQLDRSVAVGKVHPAPPYTSRFWHVTVLAAEFASDLNQAETSADRRLGQEGRRLETKLPVCMLVGCIMPGHESSSCSYSPLSLCGILLMAYKLARL